MLVLPHADGLRRNFDQLGQRILQAARNADGAAQVDIILWKFLRRQLGGGIDAGPRLADDHIADRA